MILLLGYSPREFGVIFLYHPKVCKVPHHSLSVACSETAWFSQRFSKTGYVRISAAFLRGRRHLVSMHIDLDMENQTGFCPSPCIKGTVSRDGFGFLMTCIVSFRQGCESRRQTFSSITRPTFREI